MKTLDKIAEHIATSLLDIEAVTLRPHNPFTWTSGIQSPIYCDNRLTMSHPEIRGAIADGFTALISEKFPEVEVIAGTATAGIPHAAWVSERLNLPMIYVRDKAKGHGKENQIEGMLKPGQKVVVIEDLISTGGSSIKAAEAIRASGGESLGVTAIFSYQLERAVQAFAQANLPLYTLTNYTILLDVAVKKGYIQEQDLEQLQAWRKNPSSYGIRQA
jgi:orotate phosphoribosyltransferase